jgi:ribosome-associated heat shock protein Hsp15
MTGETVRLDKWLWFARMARTRSLAARLCAAGLVTLGGTAQKPHHPVRVGDRIAVAQGRMRRELIVTALGERRGSAPEARRLYDEPGPPMPLAAAAEPWEPLFEDIADEG